MREIIQISIDILKVHPQNQEYFDDIQGEEYERFKKSISEEGIITPLIVAPDMTIVSGHQRYKACKELGIKLVPVIINEDLINEEEKLKKLLASNFGRLKNNPEKQRKVAVKYVELCGIKNGQHKVGDNRLSQEEIAKQLGISTRTLREMISIEHNLTPELKELVDDGKITQTTAAKVLAKLSKEEQQKLIADFGREYISGLTQQKVEEAVREMKNEVKKLHDEQQNTIEFYTKQVDDAKNEVQGYKKELNKLNSSDVRASNEATEENKKLHEQLNEATNRLVSAQQNMQQEIDKATEMAVQQVKDEYEEKIKQLKFEKDKALTEAENAKAEKKTANSQLSAVKDKMEEKINEAVLEKAAAFDYTPKIIEQCDKLDEAFGSVVTILNSIYKTLEGHFDDISKQRLISTYETNKSNLDAIRGFAEIPDEEQIQKIDDFNSRPIPEQEANGSNFTRLNLG